ncbi:SMI1/KNR4 family protein [Fusobacterium nucleatum]|uniref:SMI1/KNR4 family protein n=1 Tax=Fusobacterium nucleatum TaxID=851 RepID=UPI0030D0E34D
MNIAEKYIEELKKAYYKNDGKEYWDKFEKIKIGATEENIKKIKEEFPETPDSLIELLKIVDGTYHREYQGEKITFYFLGSDVMGYPYYLLSSSQILENKKDGYCLFGGYIDGVYEDVEIDEKITDDSEKIKWLHFSDCMNNGGTSQLFIDFLLSEKGVKGQIVRYLHDPDEIEVIADSFDEYLEKLMEHDLDFISKDTIY